MNRRGFGKLVLGSGLAAAVPSSVASAAAIAPARRSKYIFAVALAHNRINVTADMIVDMFKVRPSTANRFIDQMVRNGVVDAPNANGVATLTKSLQRVVPEVVEYSPGGGYVVKGRLDELTAKAKKVAKDAIEHVKDTDPNEPDVDENSTDVEEASTSFSDDDPERPGVSDEARLVE